MKTSMAILAAGGLCGTAFGQNLVVSTFDENFAALTPAEVAQTESQPWLFDFGSAFATNIFWDEMDRDGSADSGSQRFEVFFDEGGTAAFSVNDNNTSSRFFPGEDVTGFTALEFSIFFTEESVRDQFGDFGFLQLAIRNGDNFDFFSAGTAINTAGEWVDVSFDLSQFGPPENYDDVRALTLDLFADGDRAINGEVEFFLDNVRFVPTPGTAAMLMAGGLFAAGRRRR